MVSFLRGLAYYPRAFLLLTSHRLWPHLLLPGLLSLVLAGLVLAAAVAAAIGVGPWIRSFELGPQWLSNVLAFAMQLAVFVFAMSVFLVLHKHIVLVALSPFLADLAARTLVAVEGPTALVGGFAFVPSFIRTARINLRYLVRELFFCAVVFASGLVLPIVGSVVSTVCMFAIESRYCGYGLFDFPLEHQKLNVRQSFDFVRTRWALATGVGAGYLLLMIVPLFGWMVAPALGTIAGTLVAIDELKAGGQWRNSELPLTIS